MGFTDFWRHSMVQFQCVNSASSLSFGCNDFMRHIFRVFIEDHLLKGSHSDPFEEEKQSSQFFLKERKSASNTGNLAVKNFWKKMFGSNKMDEQALSDLLNMGFPMDQSKAALEKCKNDFNKALDLLTTNLESLPQINKQVSKEYSVRNLPHTKNNVIRMMLFICERLNTCTHYCMLCHSKLESESYKLRACTSENCEFT